MVSRQEGSEVESHRSSASRVKRLQRPARVCYELLSCDCDYESILTRLFANKSAPMAKSLLKKSNRRRFFKRLLRSPKLLLIVSVIVVLTATLIFENKGLWRHIQLQREVDQQQTRQEQLDTEERKVSRQVDQLRNGDTATIERVARERYGMKRPGEVIYRADSK